MTAILRTVITNGTGMGANIGKPAAGKTGTTDDNTDAYFVGYTPNIVTGVWVGSDANTVMNKSIQGGTVPAIIWKEVMKVATEPYGKAEFDYPKVVLEPFKLDPKNVQIIEGDGSYDVPEEQVPDEEIAEPDKQVDTQEVLNNVKTLINSQQQQQNPRISPPAQSVNRTAPTPIPMAVPESLH